MCRKESNKCNPCKFPDRLIPICPDQTFSKRIKKDVNTGDPPTNVFNKRRNRLPWSVDVQDTFFDSDRKSVAMVTAYYGKNGGKILRRELLPQFFTNSHEIWHRCLPWGVDVQDTFFDSGRKCVAMVTAYYGKNGGKILRRELLPQFFTNSHEIWHRCLPWGVDVQDTFFDSGRKCVAMVTAYYGKNGGKNLASRTTSSVFHQFS